LTPELKFGGQAAYLLKQQHRHVLDYLTAACEAALCREIAPSLLPAPAAIEQLLYPAASLDHIGERLPYLYRSAVYPYWEAAAGARDGAMTMFDRSEGCPCPSTACTA
jgi:hypothetical protein